MIVVVINEQDELNGPNMASYVLNIMHAWSHGNFTATYNMDAFIN